MAQWKKAVYKWLATRLAEEPDQWASTSGSAPPSIQEIAERTAPSVVVIAGLNEKGRDRDLGSGYVASADGIIVTSYHVIRGEESLRVRFATGDEYPVTTVVGYNIKNDVAALQTLHPPSAPLKTDPTERVTVGDRVLAIGDPLGLVSTVSEGMVTALRDDEGTHYIQTQAPIAPGSSGGPLLNEHGSVIGLVTWSRVDGQNLNFAVSARHISELLKHKRPISREQMLSETLVVKELSRGTTSIPGGESRVLEFSVPVEAQDGAVLTGTYTVDGLLGDDVDLVLYTTDDSGNWVVCEDCCGRISASDELEIPLLPGDYFLQFSNEFSKLAKKSLVLDLTLGYYR